MARKVATCRHRDAAITYFFRYRTGHWKFLCGGTFWSVPLSMINIATRETGNADFQSGPLTPMAETANRPKQRADARQLSGRSAAMRTLLDRIEKIAPTRASVMIAGESGVGKDIVARRLHDLSARRDGPFVPVN